MVDVSAVAGLMTALRGATDITKAMVELRDAAMIQGKVIDLQTKILDAQNAAFAANDERRELLEKIEALEAEVKRLKNLEGTGERCPRCGRNELRVERSRVASGPFQVLGVREYDLKCAACGYDDVRRGT